LTDTSNACIEIIDLRKEYGRGKFKALQGVSLEVSKGEVLGLIGPNGAGKTTLMGCLLALLKPTSGTIRINGRSPDDLATRSVTGFLPERPYFDAWMTAHQFLCIQHMLAKQPGKTMKEDVVRALQTVGLDGEGVAGRRIKKFSRGMLQRLGLAQVLIGKPQICFLDEPTSGMDPPGMTLVRNLLVEWKRQGVTVIFNSHHLDEVERVCDRVAFIKGGKIESIEELRGVHNKRDFIIKWSDAGDVAVKEIVAQCAQDCNTSLEECTESFARFTLPDRLAAAKLLRLMVAAGIPVEEATIERKALSMLFNDANESEVKGEPLE
jgi:ABC-2 type transport system ATP-binding protein